MKTDITDQSEEQKKKVLRNKERVLSNAKVLLEKRQEITSQFTKNNIISKVENFFDASKKSKESNQFLNGGKCQKIDLIL